MDCCRSRVQRLIKKIKKTFNKTIDKQPRVCYNKYRKKENTKKEVKNNDKDNKEHQRKIQL